MSHMCLDNSRSTNLIGLQSKVLVEPWTSKNGDVVFFFKIDSEVTSGLIWYVGLIGTLTLIISWWGCRISETGYFFSTHFSTHLCRILRCGTSRCGNTCKALLTQNMFLVNIILLVAEIIPDKWRYFSFWYQVFDFPIFSRSLLIFQCCYQQRTPPSGGVPGMSRREKTLRKT